MKAFDSVDSLTSNVAMQRRGWLDCKTSMDEDISASDELVLENKEKHQETPIERAAPFHSEKNCVIMVYEVIRYP